MISADALPTGRRGQWLALALLLLAVGAAYLAIVAPLLSLYAERDALIEQRRMLAPRLGAAAAELPALRARAAALRATANTKKVTLEGASDAIASANLQSRIEAVASSVGATISSTESLPAESLGDYRRIGLRLVLNGEYETLVKLLAALETATPPLILDNLKINAQMSWGRGAPGRGLDAGFEVYGFRREPTEAVKK